jgi:hypothetical protein
LRESLARQVLDDPRGAPSLDGARLLMQLALDSQQRWPEILEGFVDRLADAAWTLPEEVRAALEADALARYAEWPAAPVVRVLWTVGELPSMEVLTRDAARGDLELELVHECLPHIIERVPRGRWMELARALNAVPAPEEFEGDARYRVASLWSAISKGIGRLPWSQVGSEELVAIWNELDATRRPWIVGALSSWFQRDDERRVRLAGNDKDVARRPGSLSADLLPLAQELVRAPDDEYIVQGLRALQAIGAPEGLREAQAFARSNPGARAGRPEIRRHRR